MGYSENFVARSVDLAITLTETEPQTHRTVLKYVVIFKSVENSLEAGETTSN